MAVTRSRQVLLSDPPTVKEEENEFNCLTDASVSILKKEWEPVQLPLGRSSQLTKVQSLKLKGETIRLLTKLRPQFRKGGREFRIDKSSFAKLALAISYKKASQGNQKVGEVLHSCMTRYNKKMITNIVNENKNLQMLNFRQNISEVKHYELLEDHYTKLTMERQQLLATFHKLYNYNPTMDGLLNDINRLPNFNKQCASKRRNQRLKEKPKGQPSDKKYPLTMSNLHKNLGMTDVTRLKQEQLLQTCQIYDLRLKNIEFENSRFDLNNIKINDNEIYPMDDIYLRSDEDSDDENEQLDGSDFRFILEGLSPEDYTGKRDFDTKEEFIKV